MVRMERLIDHSTHSTAMDRSPAHYFDTQHIQDSFPDQYFIDTTGVSGDEGLISKENQDLLP